MNRIDYTELERLFAKYKEKFSHKLSPLQKDLSDELSNKLVDLNDITQEIIDLIGKLLPKTTITPGTNGTDIVNLGPFSLTLKRAYPDVPIQIDNSTVGYSRAEGSAFSTIESRKKERKLERLSSEFYRIADRISHITEKLPGLETFKCNKIRIIRNHLLEHPEGRGSGITYDSFAYSITEGPYIKGTRVDRHIQFMDEGFRINSIDFVSNLTKTIQGSLD